MISGITIALLLGGAPVLPHDSLITSAPATFAAASLAASSAGDEAIAAREAVPSEQSTGEEILVTTRKPSPGDPVEKINAKAYALTQSVDKAVIGPASHAFEHSVPQPIRNGIANFLSNLHEPVVFLNFMLQLKPGKAIKTFARFAVNTTVGVAGLFDMAKRHPFALAKRRNGFANTLGFYGVKPGAYLFLPLIGPTTVRDFFGDGLDRALLPLSFGAPFNQASWAVPTGVGKTLDKRAEIDEQIQQIRASADPYAASRDLYLKQRQAEIDDLRGVPVETLASNP